MEIKVFAVDRWKQLWRVALVDVCSIPVSAYEASYKSAVYAVMKGVFNAVEQQAEMIGKSVANSRESQLNAVVFPNRSDSPYETLKVVSSPN